VRSVVREGVAGSPRGAAEQITAPDGDKFRSFPWLIAVVAAGEFKRSAAEGFGGMRTLLLSVTDVFAFRGGLVVVDPEFDHPTAWGEVPVVLRRPDATELAVTASITIPFINRHPYVCPRKVCLFRGLGKEAIPIGTEVWLVANDPAAEPYTAPDGDERS